MCTAVVISHSANSDHYIDKYVNPQMPTPNKILCLSTKCWDETSFQLLFPTETFHQFDVMKISNLCYHENSNASPKPRTLLAGFVFIFSRNIGKCLLQRFSGKNNRFSVGAEGTSWMQTTWVNGNSPLEIKFSTVLLVKCSWNLFCYQREKAIKI